MKIQSKMNNPITANDKGGISELVLNTNVPFKAHLKKLVEIDKVNDRNAKKLYKSKEDLYAWINSKNEYDKIIGQVVSYMNLSQKELTKQQFEKNIELFRKAIKQAEKVSIDERKLIYKYKKQIIGYLNSTLLQKYKRWFYTNYFNDENHRIDATEQLIMQEIRGTRLVDRLFEVCMVGDSNLTPPRDSNGNLVTNCTIADCLQSKDRIVRQTAWLSYIKNIYDKFNTIGEMIRIKFFRARQEVKYGEFKSIFEKDMHNYEITEELGDKIFKTCKFCQDEFKRFVDYCDKAIAIQVHEKDITPWDREKGLGINRIKDLTKEEVMTDIVNALKVMDPRYQEVVTKVFKEKWIDWEHSADDGNTNCSYTNKGNNKYPIRIDFNGYAHDAIVLAHELGHSVNAEISSQNNAYEGCNDLLSEIPSFVNETIMYLYYLNVKYKDNTNLEHLNLSYLWMKRLYENICENTLYSLTVNELEKKLIDHKIFFTKEIIEMYRDIKNEYGVLLDADKEWMKSSELIGCYDIPILKGIFSSIGDHQTLVYFLGATIGVSIALAIVNGDKSIATKYYEFLKAGRTKNPIESLKSLGFDVTKQETFKPLLFVCKQLVDELTRYMPEAPKKKLEFKNESIKARKSLIK